MIVNLLLAADLIDEVANPSRTIEEQEAGATRLAILVAHGAHTESLSLEGAAVADVALLSGHISRWALNEAKQSPSWEGVSHLPGREVLENLFLSETDRVGRLLLTESILTHPETEKEFADFPESREPTTLEGLPRVWPRDYLSHLTRVEDGESARQAEADLTELGMILLQIATPASLTLLGGTIMSLRRAGKESHPLISVLRQTIAAQDEDLAYRLGLRGETGRSA